MYPAPHRPILAITAALVGAWPVVAFGQAAADPAPNLAPMVARPLFSPTRRPLPVAAPPSSVPLKPLAPPPDPAPDVALSGVILGGEGGIALLRRPADAAPARVSVGDEIDGWTVSEIRRRSVVLRRDARTITVDLPSLPGALPVPVPVDPTHR